MVYNISILQREFITLRIFKKMYFLAHMYSLLKAMPKTLYRKEILEPIIFGCWSPDAGYFPHFSRYLTIFSHTEKPTINLYSKDKLKSKLYEIGWRTHIACDDQIHNRPFFRNGNPSCPLIERDKGYSALFYSAKSHLGREIGLDVLIFNKLDARDELTNILFSTSTYNKEKIAYPGFSKLQNYVSNYILKFLYLKLNYLN